MAPFQRPGRSSASSSRPPYDLRVMMTAASSTKRERSCMRPEASRSEAARNTGLKCVARFKIACCRSARGSTCADSTTCRETPAASRTQNGPPPGSPVLATMPQARTGRSRNARACAASTPAGSSSPSPAAAKARAPSIEPGSPAASRAHQPCTASASSTASPTSARLQRAVSGFKRDTATLSMFLRNTRSRLDSARFAINAPWPAGRNRRRPRSSRNGPPRVSAAIVSVLGCCSLKATCHRPPKRCASVGVRSASRRSNPARCSGDTVTSSVRAPEASLASAQASIRCSSNAVRSSSPSRWNRSRPLGARAASSPAGSRNASSTGRHGPSRRSVSSCRPSRASTAPSAPANANRGSWSMNDASARAFASALERTASGARGPGSSRAASSSRNMRVAAPEAGTNELTRPRAAASACRSSSSSTRASPKRSMPSPIVHGRTRSAWPAGRASSASWRSASAGAMPRSASWARSVASRSEGVLMRVSGSPRAR